MYSIIWTHHETAQFSRDIYESDSIWRYNHLRHTTTEKYENNGNGWYFWFDDDNKVNYKYILSITWTWMG